MNVRLFKKLVSALVLVSFCQVGMGQGFPSIPNMPKMPEIPEWLKGGGSGGGSGAGGSSTGGSSTGGMVAATGVCAVVGAMGAMLGKKFAEQDAKRLKLNPKQKRDRENSYMLGWGILGCAMGGGAAAKVIEKMSADSKRAQEAAWEKAQQQTGPVAWQGPDAKGTTEIVERERMPDGGECGTRRDVVEAEEGTAEPTVRVCRTAGDTKYKPVLTVT